MKILLCKDCKFCRQIINSDVAICKNPVSLCEIDYVNGIDQYYTCKVMRATDCDKEAKYFKSNKE